MVNNIVPVVVVVVFFLLLLLLLLVAVSAVELIVLAVGLEEVRSTSLLCFLSYLIYKLDAVFFNSSGWAS